MPQDPQLARGEEVRLRLEHGAEHLVKELDVHRYLGRVSVAIIVRLTRPRVLAPASSCASSSGDGGAVSRAGLGAHDSSSTSSGGGELMHSAAMVMGKESNQSRRLDIAPCTVGGLVYQPVPFCGARIVDAT